MSVITIHDRQRLAAFLRRDAALHLYELGDLESPYWERTLWFGWEQGGHLQHVALLYTGSPTPVLLALGREPEALLPLLNGIRPWLPRRLNAQLSPGLAQAWRRWATLPPCPRTGGRGHAGSIVGSVVRAAQERVGLIGLNVTASNAAALRLYSHLGFRPVAEFDDVGLGAV